MPARELDSETQEESEVIVLPELLYTVKEVSKILKCNPEYVHKLRKEGLLKFMKLGSYKVRAQELDRFLETYEGFDLTDPKNIVPLE